jgi:hypothetical protein
MALWGAAPGATKRDRSGHLRLVGLHVLVGAVPAGAMGDGLQDKAGESQTGQAGPRRLVSSPSAPTGQDAARRAQSTRARPLQLLRRQWPRAQSAAARRSAEAGVGQMAVPSQPAHTLAMEEVWRRAPAVSSPPPTDDGPHLGRVATSHINGRAGWWKSPCPDLARGWDGQPPSLLYKPLVTRVFSTDRVRPPVLPCRLVPTPGVGPPGSPPSLASAWPCGHAWCG